MFENSIALIGGALIALAFAGLIFALKSFRDGWDNAWYDITADKETIQGYKYEVEGNKFLKGFYQLGYVSYVAVVKVKNRQLLPQ